MPVPGVEAGQGLVSRQIADFYLVKKTKLFFRQNIILCNDSQGKLRLSYTSERVPRAGRPTGAALRRQKTTVWLP
jgi:hypothetical protein